MVYPHAAIGEPAGSANPRLPSPFGAASSTGTARHPLAEYPHWVEPLHGMHDANQKATLPQPLKKGHKDCTRKM